MSTGLSEILRNVILMALATALGSLVGLERERQNRPAGLRTHALVSLGAALITLVSIQGFNKYGSDPFRLAAQIVSGIGFLGAGTILREGVNVKGLTTAASLWTTAGIGIAVGADMLALAVIGTFIVTFILIILGKFERSNYPNAKIRVKISAVDRAGILSEVANVITNCGVNIMASETLVDRNSNVVFIDIKITQNRNKTAHTKMLDKLFAVSGINSVKVDDI